MILYRALSAVQPCIEWHHAWDILDLWSCVSEVYIIALDKLTVVPVAEAFPLPPFITLTNFQPPTSHFARRGSALAGSRKVYCSMIIRLSCTSQ